MAAKIDGEKILASCDIEEVIGKYVALKPKGSERVGICPFHDETTPSLSVNPRKQIYKCFGCGAGGDAIDFLMRMGRTFHEAVKEISDPNNVAGETSVKKRTAKPKPLSWIPVCPAPNTPSTFSHYKHGEPSHVWTYHTATGEVAGYIRRFEVEGKKELVPYTYASDGKRSEWRPMGMAKPRPLYNLHWIVGDTTDKSVLVVEGEKTADAAQRLFPHVLVTTWVGGANGILSTDWSPLNGRKVILWPDNDWSHAYGSKHPKAGETKPFQEQPGNAAMLAIAGMIQPSRLKYIKNPEGFPCGWDIADSDWTPEYAQQYAKANIVDTLFTPVDTQEEAAGHITFADGVPIEQGYYQLEQPEPNQTEPEQPTIEERNSTKPPKGNASEDYINTSQYFKFLGWDKTEGTQKFYFFQQEAKTTLSYSASSLSKSALITLAPLKFWEMFFPGAKSANISMDAAQEFLIRSSIKAGPFNERYVRGRGAWVDNNRIIIHTGSNIIVDGSPQMLGSIESRYIYETADDLCISTENPLTAEEAVQLVRATELMNWERDINAYLLAGWCVIAPVCGALKWRPHIWLTGPRGSGKSWIYDHFVRKTLGEAHIAVQGETSEAGIRQTLVHDAIPIIFDEADVDGKPDADRIQKILALMRGASTEDGGLLLKGSAMGRAQSFRIRSCFAFASISVQAYQASDQSRLTVLGLKSIPNSDTKAERWKKLQQIDTTITDEFVARLHARTVSLLPVILKNAATFANAAAAELGEQRQGDQLGALLAGAYSLHSSKEISYQDAVKWVASKDWTEEKQEAIKDEIALLSCIMETLTSVGIAGARFERSIGEVIQIAASIKMDENIGYDSAGTHLKRLGLRVEGNKVFIANSAKYLKTILKDTAWARNHNKILMRLDGAEAKNSMRFGSGLIDRAVAIPLDIFNEN